jgi:hypothetical protein
MTVGVPPEWTRDARGAPLVGKVAPGSEPLDSAALARIQQGAREPWGVAGVIYTQVTLDRATYEKVRQDPSVYAVDVLQQVLITEIQRGHPGTPPEKIGLNPTMLYDAMERVGIAPKS